MPRVSVIIPVYNDAVRLRMCLDALAEQTVSTDTFEVIVVDNGSDDPSRELVEGYTFCQFAEESKPGSYAARNRGLELAQGELLAFTDADCLPCPDWLAEGCGLLDSDPNCAMVAGGIVVFPQDAEQPTAAELYDMAFGLPQEETVHAKGHVMTANLFTRRTIIDEVGPFDGSLMSFGDQEWSGRVVAAGKKVLYAAEAEIRHPARRTLADLVRQMRRHVGGMLDQKHKRRRHRGVRRLAFLVQHWLLPNVSKIRTARSRLKKKGYGFGAWFRTTGVILWLQYTGTFEFVRKKLGLRSERS